MADKKEQGYGVLGGTAVKPVERHGFEALSFFLYDPDRGAIMGRTPLSWAKIFVFYCIYYSCLALFWTAAMMLFLGTTISTLEPRWKLEESIIGKSPALAIRPMPRDELIDSSMIMFNKDQPKDKDGVEGWKTWQNRTKIFLDEHQQPLKKYKYCQDLNMNKTDGCLMAFNRDVLEECGKDNFGYKNGTPCVIIKLNRIFGLEHEYYEKETEDDPFPEDMPRSLADHIKAQDNKQQVWVDCHGENPADQDTMGPLTYYPKTRGFPSTYFPYLKQVGYMSPLIAVKFEAPMIGALIHMECRAWAKNIKYDRMDRVGKAHFELIIYSNDRNPKSVAK